jgi:hypothetical protein
MGPKYLTPMAMVLSPPAASRFYWFRAGATFDGAAARACCRGSWVGWCYEQPHNGLRLPLPPPPKQTQCAEDGGEECG